MERDQTITLKTMKVHRSQRQFSCCRCSESKKMAKSFVAYMQV